MFTLESRRTNIVRLPLLYSLVINYGFVCCKPLFKAGFFQLLFLSLSIAFTSVASPATGHIPTAQQIPTVAGSPSIPPSLSLISQCITQDSHPAFQL